MYRIHSAPWQVREISQSGLAAIGPTKDRQGKEAMEAGRENEGDWKAEKARQNEKKANPRPSQCGKNEREDMAGDNRQDG